jgi:hypothetical protein
MRSSTALMPRIWPASTVEMLIFLRYVGHHTVGFVKTTVTSRRSPRARIPKDSCRLAARLAASQSFPRIPTDPCRLRRSRLSGRLRSPAFGGRGFSTEIVLSKALYTPEALCGGSQRRRRPPATSLKARWRPASAQKRRREREIPRS